MVIVKESYAAYENQVEEPNQDEQGNVGLLDATATKWKNDAVNNQNTIGTIFKATSAMSFNKTPSAKTILL